MPVTVAAAARPASWPMQHPRVTRAPVWWKAATQVCAVLSMQAVIGCRRSLRAQIQSSSRNRPLLCLVCLYCRHLLLARIRCRPHLFSSTYPPQVWPQSAMPLSYYCAGYADCDGDPATGCERQLGTATDCAGCDDACTFDNAAATCEAGTCTLGACTAGRLQV